MLLLYGAYTASAHARHVLGTNLMPATIPFVAFGIYRFFQLFKRETPESPTDAMLRDPAFIVNGLLWTIATAILLSKFSIG